MPNIISAQIKNSVNIFLSKYFGAVAVFVAMAILVFGNLFFVWPEYKRIINDIESANKKEDLKYAERQKYLKQLKELKAEYQKISPDDIKKIEIMLPKKNNREELLAQMENMIARNGFLLADLRVEDIVEKQDGAADEAEKKDSIDPADRKGVNKIKINMNIVGTDYDGFKRLLRVIENNLRLLDITNLSFSPGSQKTSLEMYAYYAD